MYREGAASSYLYPFSTAYYRKFGYEIGCMTSRYKLLADKLPRGGGQGHCMLLEQGNAQALGRDIRRIYVHWQARYNLMIPAEDIESQWVATANPFKSEEYTYVYYDGADVPQAYCSFRKSDDSDGRNLRCSRFIFNEREGFGGLMGLLVSLATDHRYVILEAPSQPDLTTMLPEWSMGAGHKETVYWGMARVTHVEKVLQMARCRGCGEACLEIVDEQIPENNGIFHIAYGAGRSSQVTRGGKPQAKLTIQAFTQLILGVYGAAQMPYMPGAAAENPEALEEIFYPKPLMITAYF